MRHFTKLSNNKAIDVEFDITITETGLGDDYDDLAKYSMIYWLQNNKNPEIKRSFWVLKPYVATRNKEHGVEIIINTLGGEKGCPIPSVLKLKDFCAFTQDDFSFLHYIGSAVVNSEGQVGPYRSLLVAPKREIAVTGLRVRDEYEPGMVLLGDSRDAFI